MKNKQIIEAWLDGKPARGRSLTTDGRFLYSYALVIGRYRPSDDQPIIWDYTSGSASFVSSTTTHHINQALTEIYHADKKPLLLLPSADNNYGRYE